MLYFVTDDPQRNTCWLLVWSNGPVRKTLRCKDVVAATFKSLHIKHLVEVVERRSFRKLSNVVGVKQYIKPYKHVISDIYSVQCYLFLSSCPSDSIKLLSVHMTWLLYAGFGATHIVLSYPDNIFFFSRECLTIFSKVFCMYISKARTRTSLQSHPAAH